MANIAQLTTGDVVTVKIYKRLLTNPAILWANTYELQRLSAVAGQPAFDAVNTAVANLINYESFFHLVTTRFDRAVASTFVEDGQPYNPASFITIPTTQQGVRTIATSDEAMPLEVTLLARRSVPFGRTGRLLYRNVLAENDVTSVAGKASLAPNAVTAFITLLEIEGAGELAADLAAVGWQLVMAASLQTPGTRAVRDILPTGVVIKKLNNRYFDRTANGPTPTPTP